MIKGNCLCGDIKFQLNGDLPHIYQCHCSLCRKVSGSSSNSAMLVKIDAFQWVCGEERISSFATESGFKSDFCSRCGSPVPNLLNNATGYWVPAGLLEEPTNVSVAAHVYAGSKAKWDTLSGNCESFAEMPDPETLENLIRPKTKYNF